MVKIPNLTPKHELLSASAAKKIANDYKISLDKFAKIVESDPQVQALGGKQGDLILVHRDDPTAKYPYYRLVVKG